jgi:hypothetical protein
MKNSNDTIGNRTRDMDQVCHRLHRSYIKVLNINNSGYKYLYYVPYGQWNGESFWIELLLRYCWYVTCYVLVYVDDCKHGARNE